MTVPHVYTAIHAISAHMAHEGLAKTQSNQQQGYKFRGIDQVMNALAPLLVKHKLIIIPRCVSRKLRERQTQKGGTLFYAVIHAEFDFVSAEDGSKHTAATYGEGMDSADKATNKAMSAAYKYAAFQTFCIPTEGDGDLDADYYTPRQGGDIMPGIGSGLAPDSASEGGPRHQDVAARRPDNSNTQPPAERIQTVEPTPPKPTTSQRAIAASKPAPRPPVQEGPRSEVERLKKRSEDAFNKLSAGDKECPGINQLFNDLAQGKPITKVQDDFRRWCARVSALAHDLTEAEDKMFVKNGHLTFKAMLEGELKARADDAAKVAAA